MKVKLPLIHRIEKKTIEEIKEYFRPDVFIEYCKACKYYGKIWTCPPYGFDITKQFEGYKYVYIVGSRLRLDDLEESLRLVIERESAANAFNGIYEAARKALDDKLMQIEVGGKHLRILLAGRCLQCESCFRERQLPCINPEKAHYSLESLGFDVASMCEDILGYKIQWTKESMPEYLSLVSAILSKEQLDIPGIYDLLA
jgi:predicted metal-binding protein